MDIILLAGLWLPESIWESTAEELERSGHRPLPVALPGVADRSTAATLEDQVAAVVAAVDDADRPVVVGHSAACTLAWIAADRRPESVAGVTLIGGFPAADGEIYADFFDIVDGAMRFPGWEPFEGPDSADLDDAARTFIEAIAIPVAGGVARGTVSLSDPRRYDVPVTLVCPEFSPEQAKEWIDGGDVPELSGASRLAYVDIESGHWPMVSQPVELARILGGGAA